MSQKLRIFSEHKGKWFLIFFSKALRENNKEVSLFVPWQEGLVESERRDTEANDWRQAPSRGTPHPQVVSLGSCLPVKALKFPEIPQVCLCAGTVNKVGKRGCNQQGWQGITTSVRLNPCHGKGSNLTGPQRTRRTPAPTAPGPQQEGGRASSVMREGGCSEARRSYGPARWPWVSPFLRQLQSPRL